jgi:VIT1/CCC1 family predicted Fe2+/Mn2+ transporter
VQVRLELVRHERELNFTEHGQARGDAPRAKVFLESVSKAMLASSFSLVGALFPLILCAIAPSPTWLGLAITIIALSALGALLARTIYGSPALWGVGRFVVGVVLALVVMQLNLVG